MATKWLVLRIKREPNFSPLSSLLRRLTRENREKNKKWHMNNAVRAAHTEIQRREANYSICDITCLYLRSPNWHGFVPLREMNSSYYAIKKRAVSNI